MNHLRARRREEQRVDSMLRASRKALMQRKRKPLAKHAGATMAMSHQQPRKPK